MSVPWPTDLPTGLPHSSSSSQFDSPSDNFGSSSACSLSPAASAFSAMLSAFIGSVVNGLASGWFIAFMTGWIAWLAVFRVFMSGIYMLFRTVTNTWRPPHADKIPIAGTPVTEGEASSYLMTDLDGGYVPTGPQQGPHWAGRSRSQPTSGATYILSNIWPPTEMLRGPNEALQARMALSHRFMRLPDTLKTDVTVLGWFSWVYSAIYAPITQILWVAASASRSDNGASKIVKGLTVAVTALPLCIDCRVRYAEKLRWGFKHVFNLTNSLSCLLQASICAYLLVRGLMDLRGDGSSMFTVIPAIVYPIFATLWMVVSFNLVPIRDGARPRAADSHWAGYFLDIGMGVFAGVFLAAPAIALYTRARFDERVDRGPGGSPLQSIGDYLECEMNAWRRIAAVAP